MRANSEVLEQTNELARRLGVMSGFCVKTPNYDFRTSDITECKKFWLMACLAQEVLTGANPHIINIARRAATESMEVTGDDFAIEREFERIEHAERRTLNIDAQTKSPSATN